MFRWAFSGGGTQGLPQSQASILLAGQDLSEASTPVPSPEGPRASSLWVLGPPWLNLQFWRDEPARGTCLPLGGKAGLCD